MLIRSDAAGVRRWSSLLAAAGLHGLALAALQFVAMLCCDPGAEPSIRYVVRVFYTFSNAPRAPSSAVYLPLPRTTAGRSPAVAPFPQRATRAPARADASGALQRAPELLVTPVVTVSTGVAPSIPTANVQLPAAPPRRSFVAPPARDDSRSSAAPKLPSLDISLPPVPEAPSPAILPTLALSGPMPSLTPPPPVIPTLASVLSKALRLEHPANGNYDVVLVQPSISDALPRGWKGMASQPVYTVYLNVGDTKEWVLHYSAPDSQTRQDGSVVTLGDPRPVSPPYPRVTFLPSVLPSSGGKFLYIHGTIDASGALQNVQVIGDETPVPENFLTVLTNWLFRPARRGGDVAAVEVVLAVPARRI